MKIKKIIKKNIFGFILTAIVFGSITFVMATNIDSETAAYVTSENANVGNIADALDDLYVQSVSVVNNNPIVCYNGTCGTLSYRYWNDNFGATNYQSNELPANNYATRSALETAYGSSNFTSRPYYIRSVLIDGNVVGHEACLWHATTSKEFCFKPNYWAGTLSSTDSYSGTQTKIKLQRDMEEALGITFAQHNCGAIMGYVYCDVGSFECRSGTDGFVDCHIINDIDCIVYSGGNAQCGW